MKKSTIIFAGITAGAIIAKARSLKRTKNDKTSEVLASRAHLLTNPTFAAQMFAEKLKIAFSNREETIEAVRPFAKDVFALGYTLGRKDEITNKAINAKEQDEYVDVYLNKIF